MQDKTMFNILLIFSGLLYFYFWKNGFSINPWVRYGQYGGIIITVLYIIDGLFYKA